MWKSYNILRKVLRHYQAYKRFLRLDEGGRKQSSAPEKLVASILRLGPTFIKLGQILSTRPDILPVQYIRALEQLQEKVPVFPFQQAKKIIEEELKKPLTEIFHSFDEKPIASASLAQVHFAVLPSGEEVAVKVQRPDVKTMILSDLQNLQSLLGMLKHIFSKKIRRTNLLNGFREFKRYTLQELDFAQEGATIERFRENFKTWDDILFPQIHWEYCTEKLLTMERVSGLRLKEAIQLLPAESKAKLNTRLAEMELKMFISDGLFHADLHPGNIFFKKDGRIVLLDFGMYGELTPEERNRFVLYWLAVVRNDVKQAFYHFKKQCTELPGADEAAFYTVFKKLADSFYTSRLKEVSITRVYLNMIDAGYKYGYVFPENLLLHAKALTTAEALTFELEPDARFEEVTRPIITREFARLEPDLSKQKTLGATFTIHLACATVAMYKALLQVGKSEDAATRLIYRVGWKIYTRMGETPMLIAGMFSDAPFKKMELATQVFRMFPFTAPDYGWQDVETGKDTVGFNCTRCRVAEYFMSLGLGDLCYNTWCSLDYPLAEQWGGHLKRNGSIAGGSKICDFRWKVNPQKSNYHERN